MKNSALAAPHEMLRDWAGVLLAIVASALLVAAGGFEIPAWLVGRLKWLEVVVALLFVAVWIAELVLSAKPGEAARYRRAEWILVLSALASNDVALPFTIMVKRHIGSTSSQTSW